MTWPLPRGGLLDDAPPTARASCTPPPPAKPATTGHHIAHCSQPHDDAAYRRALNAQLIVLRSNGRIDEMIAIATTLIVNSDVHYTTAYPAGFQLAVEVEAPAPLDEALAAQLVRTLRAAKPGGVGLGIVERRPGSFRFNSKELGFGSPLSRRIL